MIRKLFSATAAVALLVATPALAETWVVDKAHSDATFQVRHMMSRVRGSFTDFTGTITADPTRPEAASVEFTVKAASIDTANDNRDKHLRSADFFEAEKFPEITFKSSRVRATAKDQYEVTGTLTMRGVSKEVTIPVSFLGFGKDPYGNEKAGFAIDFILNRKDYGIVWNKALDSGGLLLGDLIQVSINLETSKQKAAPATD
jgi:polyisoprenoid-binding protein YceI